jgi:hypothetical protein
MFDYRKTRIEEGSSHCLLLYRQQSLMTLLLITIIILDTLTEAAIGFTSKISNVSFNPDYATKYDASVNSSKERIVHPV